MICFTCKVDKPADAYSPRKRHCKVCRAIAAKAKNASTPIEIRQAASKACYTARKRFHGAVRACRVCSETRPTVEGRCADCTRAYHRERYAATIDKQRAKQAKYRDANKAKVHAATRAWRQKVGREVFNAYERKRYHDGAESVRNRNKTGYARRKGADGVTTERDWQAILACFDHRCAYCFRDNVPLARDHVIALNRGGSNWPDNIVPACKVCNGRKSDHPVWAVLAWAA